MNIDDETTHLIEDETEDTGEALEVLDELTIDEALLYASLPTPTFEVEGEDHFADVHGAGRYARAVKLTNLAIVKAERNANGDLISIENLGEIADTIAGMPVTDKHPGKATPHIIGVHTSGRVVEVRSPDPKEAGFYVLASGTWWSGRHPTIVSELVSGMRKPSIEAQSERTGCNVCGAWFDYPSQYCAHLGAFKSSLRAADNVSRLHKGMKAMGSAAVPNPAGTNTGFHSGRFYMVAEELPISEEDSGNVEADAQLRAQAKMQEDAQMETLEKELRDRIAELEASLADATAKLEAKSAELVAESAKVTALTSEKPLIIARAATLANTGLSIEEISVLPISSWDEQTFNLIAVGRKPQPKDTQGTTIVADAKPEKTASPFSVFDGLTVKA